MDYEFQEGAEELSDRRHGRVAKLSELFVTGPSLIVYSLHAPIVGHGARREARTSLFSLAVQQQGSHDGGEYAPRQYEQDGDSCGGKQHESDQCDCEVSRCDYSAGPHRLVQRRGEQKAR